MSTTMTVSRAAIGASPVLVCPRRRSSAAVRLFAFPYAGGGVAAFRGFAEALPTTVELVVVRPPGREVTLREPPWVAMPEAVAGLLASIVPALEPPFAFFGHSLGGLMAFELARALVASGRPAPSHLVVSGRRPPEDPPCAEPIHALPGQRFREGVRRLGGTPREIIDDDELFALFEPTLRADFQMYETYRFVPGPALPCPLTVFAGTADGLAPPDTMARWRPHTASRFGLRLFPGGHFFLHEQTAAVAAALGEVLS
jgi:medium-chain acyl-[acyl-carrier-protein] hydrolase